MRRRVRDTTGSVMYQVETSSAVLRAPARLRSLRRSPAVGRTVVLLGLTSLLTDVSAEMVSTVLPLYLVFALGLSPLAFGFIDGLYHGAAALVRVASGLVADRSRRHKDVAAVGYVLSAGCKLGLLAVGNAWAGVAAVIFLDRTGKGIRTAPRDALISLSTDRASLATAFGVHRAMDTAGAMLGPVLAFALLGLLPGAFDAVFVVSFCFALTGVGVLVLLVPNPAAPARPVAGERQRVSFRSAGALLRAAPFRILVLVATALGLATISDAFIYLGLQQSLNFSVGFLPLLYVGTALAYMLLALPIGRLADRVGRAPVFVGGYLLLLVMYSCLLLRPPSRGAVIGYLAVLGAYYAATDGVLMALASALVPDDLRSTGLAVLTTATSLARLLGSVLFGALWTWAGISVAVYAFGAALAATLLVAAVVLPRTGAARATGATP